MKRAILIFFTASMLMTMTSCGHGNVKHVEVIPNSSEIYTYADMNSAVNTVLDYFEENFSGCVLNEISYVGDEANKKYSEERNAEELIVFTSSFDTDYSGVDGSFNPNFTYDGWGWFLVRNQDGNWECISYGY